MSAGGVETRGCGSGQAKPPWRSQWPLDSQSSPLGSGSILIALCTASLTLSRLICTSSPLREAATATSTTIATTATFTATDPFPLHITLFVFLLPHQSPTVFPSLGLCLFYLSIWVPSSRPLVCYHQLIFDPDKGDSSPVTTAAAKAAAAAAADFITPTSLLSLRHLRHLHLSCIGQLLFLHLLSVQPTFVYLQLRNCGIMPFVVRHSPPLPSLPCLDLSENAGRGDCFASMKTRLPSLLYSSPTAPTTLKLVLLCSRL